MPRFRWVTRLEGAGSQRFLQETLAHHGIDESRLNVVARVATEREAGSLIAMGEADAAPGPRAGAAEFGLRFLPAGWEAFDFVLHRGIYFRTLFQRLVDALKLESTRDTAAALGGYDLREAGKLIWSSEG